MNDDYANADTIFEHVSYCSRTRARFYLWRILKNKLCASNLCTEDNMKGIIQDVMSTLSQAEWAQVLYVRYDVCLRAEGNQLHHHLYIYIYIYDDQNLTLAIPVAARSKAWICSRSIPEIAGSNPAEGIDVCCECCVLSGIGHNDLPIPRPEESYRVCVWVW